MRTLLLVVLLLALGTVLAAPAAQAGGPCGPEGEGCNPNPVALVLCHPTVVAAFQKTVHQNPCPLY